MKLTLKQLVESTTEPRGGLSALGMLASNEKIPAKPSYWIGKVLRRANSEMKDYHRERLKRCEALGTLKEGAAEFEFTPENRAELDKQITELQSTEIEFSGIDPIKIDALGDATVPPAVLMTLDWLIVE
jgi:hypothetical protein